MRRALNAIKRFFFPPADAPRWIRLLPYLFLGFLTFIALTGGVYAWDYTNSPQFCGTSCHTMPPEYNAYLVSPHARIACVECHIGRGFVATQITRKAGDVRHILYTITKKYEFPITADEMRPARETCERCHFPQKASDDSLREIQHFTNDASNTPYSIFLILKTGGGSKRLGLGKGIHWHIENKILYYAEDKAKTQIPYVRVYNDDGSITEYVDIESDFDPASIAESQLEEMDCITCHNRITHVVHTPENSMDTALAREAIDHSIPEIRRLGVEMLRATYVSMEQANVGIAGIESYYRLVYPDYYEGNAEKIQDAIAVIQDIYQQSVFLEQKSDWNSHPNNIGHKDFPGCFRCHDGKHLTVDNEAIRLECNLCHSIPVVAGTQDFVTDLEISRGPEPETHLDSSWIVKHRDVFNETCSNCHTTENPGGTDNTSFCSNSACHGSAWEFAGFDAPKLRQIIASQVTPTPTPAAPGEALPLTYDGVIGQLLTSRCGSCHGENAIQGLNMTTYQTLMSGSTTGPVILPGDAEGSLIITKISGERPHFAQLTPEELELLIEWINQGAPED
jgi:nitrate/TMAO reductase-like tetraheme cytochrome c subunit